MCHWWNAHPSHVCLFDQLLHLQLNYISVSFTIVLCMWIMEPSIHAWKLWKLHLQYMKHMSHWSTFYDRHICLDG
jgi:hypothetical protein